MAFHSPSSQATRVQRLWVVHTLPHFLLVHPAASATDLLLPVRHHEGGISHNRAFEGFEARCTLSQAWRQHRRTLLSESHSQKLNNHGSLPLRFALMHSLSVSWHKVTMKASKSQLRQMLCAGIQEPEDSRPDSWWSLLCPIRPRQCCHNHVLHPRSNDQGHGGRWGHRATPLAWFCSPCEQQHPGLERPAACTTEKLQQILFETFACACGHIHTVDSHQ